MAKEIQEAKESVDKPEDAKKGYEHGEDFVQTANTIASDEKIGIENIFDVAQNNFASTKTKDYLTGTAEGRKIAEGLEADPNSQEYQEAKAQLIQVYQNIRGIEESEVVHYDAKTTQQDALQDIDGVIDIQGATLTQGENAGTILLDVSGNENRESNKEQDIFVAGHEIGETAYLQNGDGLIFEDSYETKEAMNNALGDSLTNRVNQATDGAITSTSYTTTSNDYVEIGTGISNSLDVVEDGVEYRQINTDETVFIDNSIDDFKSQYKDKTLTGLEHEYGDDEAKRLLTTAAKYMVDEDAQNEYNANAEYVSGNEFSKEELTTAMNYLKDKSEGLTFVHQDTMNAQAYFTATPEQFKDADHSTEAISGLEDTSLILFAPAKVVTPLVSTTVAKVGSTPVKELGETIVKVDPSLTVTGAGVATGISAYTNYDKYDDLEYVGHVITDGAVSFLVGKYMPAGSTMTTSMGYGALGGSISGASTETVHQALDVYVFDNQKNMDKSKILLNSGIEATAGTLGKFYNSMGDMMNGGHIINDAIDLGVSQSFKPLLESQRNSFENQTKKESE